MNRGKTFEREIHKMLKCCPETAWVHRPTDVPPMKGTRFSPSNPIDLLGYLKPSGRGIVVECKATKGKSLPFKSFFPRKEDRKQGSRTSFRQWGALYRCWRGNVHTYVAINAYGQPGRHGQRGEAYLVNFGVLRQYREVKRRQRKSWNIEELIEFAELDEQGPAYGYCDTNQLRYVQLEKATGGWKCPKRLG